MRCNRYPSSNKTNWTKIQADDDRLNQNRDLAKSTLDLKKKFKLLQRQSDPPLQHKCKNSKIKTRGRRGQYMRN